MTNDIDTNISRLMSRDNDGQAVEKFVWHIPTAFSMNVWYVKKSVTEESVVHRLGLDNRRDFIILVIWTLNSKFESECDEECETLVTELKAVMRVAGLLNAWASTVAFA